MKKFIAFTLLVICILSSGKFLLNNSNKNQQTSNNKTNSKHSLPKENEDSTLDTDNIIENNNEIKESILVDIGDNQYIVRIDSNSKELLINENIYNSENYIKVNYEEILPFLKDIKDYKDLSIVEYISLYNKVSPYINTNMSYSQLLSIASNLNIDDLKSNYNELVKMQENNG